MKITIDFPKLKFNVDVLTQANIPKVLQQEMLTTRTDVIATTLSGKTADGGGLKPYSASYRAAIDSGRIAGKAPGNHTPNLSATGELLRSMQITNLPDGAEMTFQGTHAPGRRVSAAGAARKQKAGGIVSTALKGRGSVKSAGGGGTGRSAGGGGGGKSVPNATIAQAQYSQGRTGWMAFSVKRVEGITKAVGDALAAALKNLIT